MTLLGIIASQNYPRRWGSGGAQEATCTLGKRWVRCSNYKGYQDNCLHTTGSPTATLQVLIIFSKFTGTGV
jgi:hypothetical protein